MKKIKNLNDARNFSVRFWSSLNLITFVVLALTINTAGASDFESNRPLTMNHAIDLGLKNDPWLKGNEHSQFEVESMAISAGQLPDPKISLGVANIGADNFDFGQEPMTQFKVGFSQMIPRGKSLSLRQEKLNTLAKQFPHQRENRKAQLALQIGKLWLSAYQEQESIRLIEKDRSLFEHLVDVAEASYSSDRGKTRQHDIVRAQLELTRLEDRLTMLSQNLEANLKQLSEFISGYYLDQYTQYSGDYWTGDIKLAGNLPEIKLMYQGKLDLSSQIPTEILLEMFVSHPAVDALNMRIKAEEVNVELAEQKYKPAWGLNTSYGYRDDADNNMSRADLFSVGISFDLPIFTKNRQDQDLKAAVSSLDSIETQKWQLLRKLMSSFETHKAQLIRLNQRKELYANQLLPQMNEQAEASLTAYTNDDGDFAEVVRARIAELNAQIDALKINVSIQKTIIELNYLFMDDAGAIAASVPEKTNDQ